MFNVKNLFLPEAYHWVIFLGSSVQEKQFTFNMLSLNKLLSIEKRHLFASDSVQYFHT